MDTIGVIFDMDGVLVDSAAAHLQSWQALAVELSRTITPEQFARTFGQRSAEIIAQLFGVFDATEVKRLDARKEFLYRGLIRGRVPEMPGATSLIDRLHHAGFRLAIGSSGPPENVEMVIGELGWGGRLDASPEWTSSAESPIRRFLNWPPSGCALGRRIASSSKMPPRESRRLAARAWPASRWPVHIVPMHWARRTVSWAPSRISMRR